MLDLGCGTGSFAALLVARGYDVTGVDPARASLDVARAKPGAERVRWVEGDSAAVAGLEADVVTMTGNVAQAIHEPAAWDATLDRIFRSLVPGGYLVFETRDPSFRAWTEWNRERSHRIVEAPGAGPVESWVEVTRMALPLVTFRWTFVFADGTSLTSDSTLRFRTRAEVEAQLSAHGYSVEDVRDAPDRPGRELVFLARRPG